VLHASRGPTRVRMRSAGVARFCEGFKLVEETLLWVNSVLCFTPRRKPAFWFARLPHTLSVSACTWGETDKTETRRGGAHAGQGSLRSSRSGAGDVSKGHILCRAEDFREGSQSPGTPWARTPHTADTALGRRRRGTQCGSLEGGTGGKWRLVIFIQANSVQPLPPVPALGGHRFSRKPDKPAWPCPGGFPSITP